MTIENWDHIKRIVVKIGSQLLLDPEEGVVNHHWLAHFAVDLMKLVSDGKEIVLVSSGSVSVGKRQLAITTPNQAMRLEEKQAAAATGQPLLMQAYSDTFGKLNQPVAQLLLDLQASDSRRHYLNAQSTIETLLDLGVIPIVNENDTITTAELKVGDNDRLAARVAQMVSADALVLLSDIDGLYDKNPKLHNDAILLKTVDAVTPEILAMAGEATSAAGTGGMITKLQAAEIAMGSGCHMIITNGDNETPITRFMQEQHYTHFVAETDPFSARKSWILHHLQVQGNVVLDAGAVHAIKERNSLLPIGVKAVEGTFDRGDVVSISAPDGVEIGRGVVAYDYRDAEKIVGKHTKEIEKILGFIGRDVLIHRSDMAFF